MSLLWLHIGHGKTGTSALQEHLLARSENLGDLLYPRVGGGSTGPHYALFPLPRHSYSPDHLAFLRKVAGELTSTPRDAPVVMSSEHLCYAGRSKARALKRIFGTFDIRILYYIRRQSDLVESAFRQMQVGRPGKHPDPVAFLEATRNAFDYEVRLAPWEEAFGAENITIRLYHRETCASDIVADAEAAIGLAPSALTARVARRNESLSPDAVRRLIAFDKTKPRRPERRAFLERLRQERPISPGAPFFGSDVRRELMDRHRESNARIAARYLDPQAAALLLRPET